jgi:hypothetical protein
MTEPNNRAPIAAPERAAFDRYADNRSLPDFTMSVGFLDLRNWQ